jgi:hypothetical protein
MIAADTVLMQDAIALGAQRVNLSAPVSLAAGTLSNTARRIILEFDGVQFAQPPNAYYEVYCNQSLVTPPRFDSIFYVGNLTFFAHVNSPYSQYFDITDLFHLQLQLGLARINVAHITLVLQAPPDSFGAIKMAPGANVRITGVVVTDVLPDVQSPLP